MGESKDYSNDDVQFHEKEIPKLTPSPRKRSRAKIAEDEDYCSSPSKRDTASPSKTAPTCLEEASDVERLIWQLKEEKKSWSEIQTTIEKTFGQLIKMSALTMKYTRMKRNFAVINEADVPYLIEGKKAVDAQFERERWFKVAAEIEKQGGGKYDGAVLQKKFKQLEKDGLV